MTSQQQYIALCLELLRHCYLYYECFTPEMLDYDYDMAYRKLVDYEEATGHVVPFSPTQIVGFDHESLFYGREGGEE